MPKKAHGGGPWRGCLRRRAPSRAEASSERQVAPPSQNRSPRRRTKTRTTSPSAQPPSPTRRRTRRAPMPTQARARLPRPKRRDSPDPQRHPDGEPTRSTQTRTSARRLGRRPARRRTKNSTSITGIAVAMSLSMNTAPAAGAERSVSERVRARFHGDLARPASAWPAHPRTPQPMPAARPDVGREASADARDASADCQAHAPAAGSGARRSATAASSAHGHEQRHRPAERTTASSARLAPKPTTPARPTRLRGSRSRAPARARCHPAQGAPGLVGEGAERVRDVGDDRGDREPGRVRTPPASSREPRRIAERQRPGRPRGSSAGTTSRARCRSSSSPTPVAATASTSRVGTRIAPTTVRSTPRYSP